MAFARPIGQTKPGAKRVLFLGYNEDQSRILHEISLRGCNVWHTSENLTDFGEFDLVVSFGHRHIVPGSAIATSNAPIVNLHISFLPWNRGAHPNFWSFYDCTPSGISVHLMDEYLDTGPILYQRYVNFAEHETTFVLTHKRLIAEIETLFLEKFDEILAGKYVARPQRRPGSYHRTSDLPKEFSGWHSEIQPELLRLDNLLREKGD